MATKAIDFSKIRRRATVGKPIKRRAAPAPAAAPIGRTSAALDAAIDAILAKPAKLPAIPVRIDDRAGSKELVRLPPLSTPRFATLCRLRSGDIEIIGNGLTGHVLIGIEYKSLADLIASMSTGRLQDTQLRRMREDYDLLYILYYGSYRCGSGGQLQVLVPVGATSPLERSRALETAIEERRRLVWSDYKIASRIIRYSYLEAFLHTIAASGVRVKHVADAAQAAEWIATAALWWDKPADKHQGLLTFDDSVALPMDSGLDPGVRDLARVVAKLPVAIGYMRAVKVARHFRTMLALVSATPEEWAEIPGIGKTIARAITRWLRDG